MQTKIEYGVYYYRSSTVVPWCSEAAAHKEVEKLRAYGVVAEVRCRRVTMGVWTVPKTVLLSGG